MQIFSRTSAFACAIFAVVVLTAAPAWAVYDQKIVLVGAGAEGMSADKVSFTTATGQSVPVRAQADDDDDRSTFMLGFPGNAAEGGRLTVGDQTYTVPAADFGETLYVDLETGRVGTRSPGRDYGWTGISLRAGAAYGEVEAPEVGIGLVGFGSNERFALQTEDRIPIATTGASLGFDPGFWGVRLSLSGYFGWGDDDASAQVSPDGGAGVVYGQDVGTTGLLLGNVDLDVAVDTEVDTHGIKLKGFWPDCGCEWDGWNYVPFTYVAYRGIDQEHRLNVTSQAFANQFSQERHQDVDEKFFEFGVGGMFSRPLSDRLRFNFAASAGGAYRDAELESQENNFCSIGGCNANNNQNIDIKDEDDGFTYTLGAGVNLEWMLAPNADGGGLGLDIGTRVNFIGDVAQVHNPVSGNDVLNGETTRLDDDGSLSYAGGVYLAYSF